MNERTADRGDVWAKVPRTSPDAASSARNAAITWARDLASAIAETACALGANQADATVGSSSVLEASARDGAVEDISRAISRSAAVRVVVDGRVGFATQADAPLRLEEIRELCRAAIALARLSTPSAHNTLLSPTPQDALAVGDLEPSLATYFSGTAELPPAWVMDRALELERAVRRTAGITGVKNASASVRRGAFALATSSGFVGAYRATQATLACSAVVDDGGRMQVESHYDVARDARELMAPEAIAAIAAERTLARRGARKIASTSAPVVFDPNMARGFFGSVLNALSGDSVTRQQSWLRERKGSVILPPGLRLLDDPLLPSGLGTRPFDGEGLKSAPMELVDATGRLLGFFHDAQSASRLGESPTGHAARGATGLPHPGATNTLLLGGAGDLAQIIAATPRGLLVTRLLGGGPDMVTGDYSRGASGFWIEDGALAFPVEELTISGHMDPLMRGIDRVGADLDRRGALRAPSLRFAEMAIGGR